MKYISKLEQDYRSQRGNLSLFIINIDLAIGIGSICLDYLQSIIEKKSPKK